MIVGAIAGMFVVTDICDELLLGVGMVVLDEKLVVMEVVVGVVDIFAIRRARALVGVLENLGVSLWLAGMADVRPTGCAGAGVDTGLGLTDRDRCVLGRKPLRLRTALNIAASFLWTGG